LEEYVPGRITMPGAAKAVSFATTKAETATNAPAGKLPLRGAIVIGGHDEAEVLTRARALGAEAVAGRVPPLSVPAEADLRARVRLAIDYGDAEELATKVDRAIKALEAGQPAMWRALRNQGVFLGRAAPAPVAFLYTGQGSQYLNMLRTLQETEPIVADTFAEADRLMTPILGRPLSDYLFVDSADPSATAAAEEQLRQTEITQPAVLTVDQAITRLLDAYAIQPDMVIGHSLGEYGALVAVGAMSFAGALEAVSARGREMAHVAVADNGLMAAVFAPLEEIQEVLAHVDGYVVIANINSTKQAVIGGASAAVRVAVERLMAAGHEAMVLPVSHAFHTEIVAPAACAWNHRRCRSSPTSTGTSIRWDRTFSTR
jgi:acyl transferase domain-containing protein